MDGGNALWTYFSLSARAGTLETSSDEAGQIALLNRQIKAMRSEMTTLNPGGNPWFKNPKFGSEGSRLSPRLEKQIQHCAILAGVEIVSAVGVWEKDLRILLKPTDEIRKSLFHEYVKDLFAPDARIVVV
jgi:hypothetical protein